MALRRPKRPTDVNQLGKLIVDISVRERQEEALLQPEDSGASEFARQGGLRGGVSRAAKLSPQRRKEIARLAASTRWKHDK
jgi:hypothetical protein